MQSIWAPGSGGGGAGTRGQKLGLWHYHCQSCVLPVYCNCSFPCNSIAKFSHRPLLITSGRTAFDRDLWNRLIFWRGGGWGRWGEEGGASANNKVLAICCIFLLINGHNNLNRAM